MDDSACVGFLQWALPHMRMRWAGFRKVRKQVCKRINRRIKALDLPDAVAYKAYLQHHHAEWQVLDQLCRIHISRFYRDQQMFSLLQAEIMPALIRNMHARGERRLRIWSAGCAAGEEPYTLSIIWELAPDLRVMHAQSALQIIASDSDPQMLARAEQACYTYSSIKYLPANWTSQAFEEHEGEYCLRQQYRHCVKFVCQDIRDGIPAGYFDLILCRNLICTYFEESMQEEILRHLELALHAEGILVLGIHESLPRGYDGLAVVSRRLGIYQRRQQDG